MQQTGDALTLADRSLTELLGEVASERPAPGGGSAAAIACAIAAGLAEMSAAFSVGRGEDQQHEARMEHARSDAALLREQLVALAERDLTAYAPVLDALRLPSATPARGERIDEALSGAADAPLETAAAGAQVAELAADAARHGNPHVRGDAITGALLAEAGCRAAVRLVELNLARAPGDARLRRADELAARAWNAREEALR